ncbi:uncharacterized protein [Epargyreus clarus]|uniref:uncharacterized protein n=1 Tax=Epargyreus clarus TaxID=520877 RepID=UPI003C2D8713
MKGVSPSNNKGSPKTPGGISKSLLTPCRRVGLSRKWKKSGCSPFISPLSTQNSTPENNEDNDMKKRKKCVEHEVLQNKTSKGIVDIEECNVSISKSGNSHENNDITNTPSRAQIPRKKSKTLSLALKTSDEINDVEISSNKLVEKESHSSEKEIILENTLHETNCREIGNKTQEIDSKPTKQLSDGIVSKPVRTESKGKSKLSLKKSNSKSDCNDLKSSKTCNTKPKEKSPNNLTKECIVVIQNKIFKNESEKTEGNTELSQESDKDCDIPLSLLKRKSTDSVTLNTLNDDDFIRKPKELQSKKKRNLSMIKQSKSSQSTESTNVSQSSQEDLKRTILVKKTYEKVTTPLKAKSTGSITQKDIDDMRERIEMKKKLLMAKAMSIDNEELRSLIKKWQKGCQDALMELLELMKKKLPDQRNMDYAEILQTLKIPPELVGYDAENDCFVTPDDVSVLMSTFKI